MTEGTDFTYLPVGDGGTAAVAFLRDEVNSYAGAVSDAAILAVARPRRCARSRPRPISASSATASPCWKARWRRCPISRRSSAGRWCAARASRSDPANKDACLAHCAAGNPQEGEQDYAASLFDGVVVRMTPTDAFMAEGYGYQPPEHWQAIHDSAVASGALSEPLADLSAVYTNEFVAGWNA